MYLLQSAWLVEDFVWKKSAPTSRRWLSRMPELFSGFGIAFAMMTETCRQFKRIDFGREKRCVHFLLAKFRFKHYTDCDANQFGITLGRDMTPRFEGVRLVLQSRSDSTGCSSINRFTFLRYVVIVLPSSNYFAASLVGCVGFRVACCNCWICLAGTSLLKKMQPVFCPSNGRISAA